MSETAAELPRTPSQLDYLPVGLFGSVMGLTGLSVAWRLALAHYGAPAFLAPIAPALGILAMMSFLALLAGYAVKAITAFHLVKAEFNHPIAGSLFGTLLIQLIAAADRACAL